jgi:DNA-binding NtrC family response regulator
LSISLGIATSHGGALRLCEADAGACFELTLPAAAVQTASPAGPVRESRTARSPRALVVEDEAPVRVLLLRLLARRGYDVVDAASLGDARQRLDGTTFDVVLCDVRLGEESGVDCYRQVSARHPELARAFIFVTGDAGAVWTERDLVDVPVLSKPFTATDLDRALAELTALMPNR